MYLRTVMNLYDHIDIARKFGDGSRVAVAESVTERELGKTAVALSVAKHLKEAKQPEDKPVQLSAMPLAN